MGERFLAKWGNKGSLATDKLDLLAIDFLDKRLNTILIFVFKKNKN